MTALLCALLLAAAPQAGLYVAVSDVEGDVYCDVQAKDVPVHQVLGQLARELDVELRGFEDVLDSPRVNVHLEHRPVDQTLQYVLGAVGLKATHNKRYIVVSGDLRPFADATELRTAAAMAYTRALQRYPHSAEAPAARMALAQLALGDGDLERAVGHYEELTESYPQAPLAQDAHMAAGRLLVQLEEWGRAQPHFQAIANVSLDEEPAPELARAVGEARRELARCILWRGEPRRAMYMLQGLDDAVPAQNDSDRAQRWLLLARAVIELGQAEQGMLYLDRISALGPGVVSEFEGMDLRARAMELSGRPVEAVVAWLKWSQDQEGEPKRRALVRAARLALSTEGEELSVIFIHKLATDAGFADDLKPFANEARSRLGLEAESYDRSSPTMRLERGEQLLVGGSPEQAHAVFEALESDLWALPPDGRRRFALAYAPLVEESQSVDAAIELLRQVARTLESRDNRAPLYLLAAEIYERHGRYDEAAEAYGGKL